MTGRNFLSIIALSLAWIPVIATPSEGTPPAKYDLQIERQPLDRALQEFAKQSGVQIIFFSRVTEGFEAPSLSGRYTAAAALQQLLNDSKLTFRELNPKTIEVQPKVAMDALGASSLEQTSSHADLPLSFGEGEQRHNGSFLRLASADAAQAAGSQSSSAAAGQQPAAGDDTETVVVTADGSQVKLPGDYAGGQVARGGRVGLFGNLDIMDTPFNATNYTAEFMRNLQARSVADVAQSDPGVRVARGFGNFQELYVVRGFPVYSDDVSYNGLYGLLPRQYVAAEFLERVEVLRGANSFLNGAAPGSGSIGGAFNLVPKRAANTPLTRLTLGFENEGQFYGAFDVSRRFGAGEQFGMRVNGVRRDGDTSVDDEGRELGMLSLGVDYRGERARFSADFGRQNHHIDSPRPSVTPFFLSTSILKAPEASSNFAQNWSFTEERDFFGVIRGEIDFTENAKLWAATGLRDGTEHNILSNPTADQVGNATAYRFDNYREDRITASEVGFRAEFKTGGIGHRLSTSATIFKLDSKNAYAFSSFFMPFAYNIYDPVQVPAPAADFFTGGILFDPLTTSRIDTMSYAVADMLSFMDDRLLVTLGARNQTIEQRSFDYNSGVLIDSYDESRVTPVFAVVVKPSERISLYGNYAEGLLRGDVAPLTFNNLPVVNAGEVFKPFQSEQIEVGAKYDNGDFGGVLSVFRVSKPLGIVVDQVFGPDGEQLHKGVEFSLYGEPVAGLRLLGGATFLDAQKASTQSGLSDGTTVIGVPDVQANLGVDWDVPGAKGLTLDGRVVYTSSQTADATDTLSIPSWTRLDVGARYTLPLREKVVTMRARLDNATDENYWGSVGGSFDANYMVLGLPRTFTLSASIDL